MPIVAVDLFCGAGGLTRGLIDAGIPVAAGVDFDDSCRYAYEFNNGAAFIKSKIEDVHAEHIRKYYEDDSVKVLVGCAPCQPFSTHSNKYNKDVLVPKDERWFLLNHFARLVREVKPDIISMENVPQLTKQSVFQDFTDALKEEGYSFSWSIVYCPSYGIPQKRNRLVLLASRYGEISLIPPTNKECEYLTVRNAIGKLSPIPAGGMDENDPLHKSSLLTKKNMDRIRNSVPGGSWRDWDESLVSECHKKDTGSTYVSVYSRMEWDVPSPTITTQFYNFGTGRFGHPEQNRALSLREGALLQTFPIDYRFAENESSSFKRIGKMIGNAVPVQLGNVVGQSIRRHLIVRGVIDE